MARKTPHTLIAVEVGLVGELRKLAARNHRSIVGEVAHALTEYVEREAERDTDAQRG